MQSEGVEHEDVVMKFLETYLTEVAQRWFDGLPNNHLTTYEYLTKLFKSRWSLNKYRGMLMNQFNQIRKKEDEIVSEFDTRFDKLHNQIPQDLFPTTIFLCLLYVNEFEGKFSFILRDNKPRTLEKSKEYSADIEENLMCLKFDHFQYPCAKEEPK